MRWPVCLVIVTQVSPKSLYTQCAGRPHWPFVKKKKKNPLEHATQKFQKASNTCEIAGQLLSKCWGVMIELDCGHPFVG